MTRPVRGGYSFSIISLVRDLAFVSESPTDLAACLEACRKRRDGKPLGWVTARVKNLRAYPKLHMVLKNETSNYCTNQPPGAVSPSDIDNCRKPGRPILVAIILGIGILPGAI